MVLEPEVFIRNARFTISAQAKKILSHTKYTTEDLMNWYQDHGIGVGGNDAAFFLEAMHDREAQK